MATRCAAASTNWTTSTTWATIDATSFNNSESANTALTTSFVESTGATTGAITVDAILVKIASRASSPTGTMTVHLAVAGVEVTGTAVTVNVSDLPTCVATTGTTTPVETAEGGWFCCKFAAPVLLLTATSYTVGAKTSSSTQVNLWSSATTNWSRALRTTATANMAAGDDAIITKEWTAANTGTARTVTMDETATTDYGSNTTSQVTPSLAITQGGTLTFSTGIAANLRQSGYVIVYNGGTLNIGASGAEVARGSTAVLQFDCASDGDFGLVARKGATVNTAGLSRTSGKNVVQTLLNADASASATSITIVDDTGWLSGDLVCLAPTTQTNTQFESKALTGNATSTTAAISALTSAHSGTSPTQAEVGLLTRNVQVAGVTANVVTFFYVATTAVISCSWTDFRYIGTNAAGKRGVEINTTTGSFASNFCAFRDCDSNAIYMTGSTLSNVTVQDFIIYNANIVNMSNGAIAVATATSGTWTINRGMICGGTQGPFVVGVVYLTDVGGTLSNVSISGYAANAPGGAYCFAESGGVLGTFSSLTAHSNACSALYGTNTGPVGTINGLNIWRNGGNGATWAPNGNCFGPLVFKSGNFFGNSSIGFNITSTGWQNLVFDTCTFNSDTTFTQAGGLRTADGASGTISLLNCSFSVVSGIKTKNTVDLDYNAIVTGPQYLADNTILNGTTVLGSVSGLVVSAPILQAQNYGQTANDNRVYYANKTSTPGVIQSDSGTVHGADLLSEKMTPGSTSLKLRSAIKYVACNSGSTVTFSIYVQKNGTYNGNAPRLILLQQNSMGVTADTVCATFSAGANTWQQLSYTTGSAPQNGVYAFIVDCDGTAGSIFAGDAAAS